MHYPLGFEVELRLPYHGAVTCHEFLETGADHNRDLADGSGPSAVIAS